MIKNRFTIISFVGLIIVAVSCSSTNRNVNDNKSVIHNNKEQVVITDNNPEINNEPTIEVQKDVKSRASSFVKKLQAGEKLSLFFNELWIFIYHEDNRCDGSTDGQLENVKSEEIDSEIRLQVKNDGEGWACEKKEPKSFNLDFDLMNKIKNWDRFEIPNDEYQNDSIVYVVGAGESDYLKLHYNDNDLIIKLEYRSEDPG